MEPTLSQVELYKHLFGRVNDAYGESTRGGVTTVREPLTEELITSHLNGSRHLGFFLVDPDGMVDRGYIDIDIHKDIFDNPKTTREELDEHWEAARSRVYDCACVLAAVGIEFYVETSRRRGFHIVVHTTEPIPAGLMRQLLTAVTVEAQVKAEIFPKQAERGPDGFGNFIFGMLHGKSIPKGKTVAVEWRNGFHVIDSWEVLEGLKTTSLETIASALAYLQKDAACHSFAPQGGSEGVTPESPASDLLDADLIGIGIERCKVLDSYKWNATEAGRLTTGDGEGEHAARVALANYCRVFDGGKEWAVDAIFKHLDDYDPTITNYQLEKGLKGKPPLCSSLCPGGLCDDMKAVGGKSPIKFAYTDGRAHGFTAVEEIVPAAVVTPSASVKEKTPPPPLFESLAELLSNPPRPRWLVKNLIETPATGVIFGPTGAGKSFIGVDLASSAATSRPWAGKDILIPGVVYYLAGEGRTGLLRRFRAWQLVHGVMIPTDRLYISSRRIELDERSASGVEQEVERRVQENGIAPSLVIVDTLARSLPSGADENSAKDVGAFINIVDRIRDHFGCVVLVLHHTGHNEETRARGSSALKAAMDIELSVRKRGVSRIAEWTKLKDLPDEPSPQEFVLEHVVIDALEDGELVTSAVVKWEGKAAITSTVTTTKTEDLGLKTLHKAIGASFGPAATIEAWRIAFYSEHWGDNDKTKKQAFCRLRESLATKKLVRIIDGLYSIPS